MSRCLSKAGYKDRNREGVGFAEAEMYINERVPLKGQSKE